MELNRRQRIAAARSNHKHDWAIRDNRYHVCTVCARTVKTSVLSNLQRAQRLSRILNAAKRSE